VSRTISAVEYLAGAPQAQSPPVCVIFGGDAFLKRLAMQRFRRAVLGDEDGTFSFVTFDGDDALWRDVRDELATRAMFGGKRLVAVEDADEFVTNNRPQLEDYVARPLSTGVLLLEVSSFPATTRLHKAVAAAGLAIDCAAPVGKPLLGWLARWAKQQHGIELPAAAAEAIVELIGPELGLIDQELAKLALAVGRGKKVSAELVGRTVGNWRVRKAWDMLDAALGGNAPEAMAQLERLLSSGEHPISVLAQIAATLRRFAAATRLVLQTEAAGRKMDVRQALQEAGVKPFVLQKSEMQLRHLNRHRGAQLHRWLIEADLDLKGDSRLPPRLILERMILRLAAPQKAAAR
jgi:DNA polymerase-3 subunit delta